VHWHNEHFSGTLDRTSQVIFSVKETAIKRHVVAISVKVDVIYSEEKPSVVSWGADGVFLQKSGRKLGGKRNSLHCNWGSHYSANAFV
jgi:hypothetical protein